jgi:hypothetical protein
MYHPPARFICSTHRDQLKAEGRDHLVEAMLCAMEEVWGGGFEEGVNPELEYLDHLQVRSSGFKQ